jgi:glycosyltransferase involved in cell wall biosynthesis
MTADCVGGVWTYALELAAALAPHRVEVHLATMGPAPDGGQRSAAEAVVAGLHESAYALEWEDDPWGDVDRAGEWLLGLADDIRPDVVHLNGYTHAALPWESPVLVAAHSDVLSWWRAVRGTGIPEWLERYRDRVQAGLRAADLVCAPTQAVLDDLDASYVFETPRAVVANGRTARRAVGAEEPLVVGLGRFWDEAKNIAALQRVADRVPWPVLVAGPGTSHGRVSQADAARLLARASIFASPARYEPFGLAALEAAQAGCALVLGDLASLREVWGDAAAYVWPDDDEALLATLRQLCDDDRRRTELAARARERAARYTPARVAAATLALYERIPAGAAA